VGSLKALADARGMRVVRRMVVEVVVSFIFEID
jgi:hypothetical protein